MDKNLERLKVKLTSFFDCKSLNLNVDAEALAIDVMKLVRPVVENEAERAYSIGYNEGYNEASLIS